MAETFNRQRSGERSGGVLVEHPADPAWRADGLAKSRHSRLSDSVRRPLESHDVLQARSLCGSICREALGDFTPALLLLPADERRRAQVLFAFTQILIDFARQPGLEGDRLSEINRWEFGLELALEGEPVGQPIFVLLAQEEVRRPWKREALDRLLAAARRRIIHPERIHETSTNTVAIAEAFLEALLEVKTRSEAGRFGAALTELRSLYGSSGGSVHGTLPAALRERLEAGPGPLPPLWARPARYLQLAGLRIVQALEGGVESPRLGITSRLSLLARARFFKR